MPTAAEVTPQKWTGKQVLFDDGVYSVISGFYEGGENRVLGERWNDGGNRAIGFPNVAGYPIWHVVPEFLAVPILNGLLVEVARRPHLRAQYLDQIVEELNSRQPARE
jgi:hypothetical protein